MCTLPRWFVVSVVVAASACAGLTYADETPLKPGMFPPPDSGTFLAGELVVIDPVNRRGGLRLDGDGGNRYHDGPLHYFAMLPCGAIWYHGAPAELREIPIGTHVQGFFYVPPVGEEETIPPLPAEQAKYEIKQNHAVSLEDDVSYYHRRGQAWKVVKLDVEKGKLDVEPVGKLVKEGINKPYTFDIDSITRIWKQRKLVDLADAAVVADIAVGQTVDLNLTWSPGWRDKEFGIADVWLDDESRDFAAELQRRRHIRYQKQHWVPGWIDAVEHNDYGGGIVTLTLFGGMDSSLYEDLKTSQDKGFGVGAAEKTLRTWFHRADKKIGQVLEWKETPNPPPGSSGIQVKLKFTELLDGYRPGRAVRVKSDKWIFVTMPTEERIKSVEDQKRSLKLGLP